MPDPHTVAQHPAEEHHLHVSPNKLSDAATLTPNDSWVRGLKAKAGRVEGTGIAIPDVSTADYAKLTEAAQHDEYYTRTDEYVKRFMVRETIKLVDADGKETGKTQSPEIDATLMTPVINRSREVERWKPVHVKSFKEAKAYNDSVFGKSKRMMEAGFGFDIGANAAPQTGFPDPTQLIDREYIPMMWGPFYKQLYIYDYLVMHARAFEMSNHNALAAAAIKMMTRFTLGRGISFNIKHKGARSVWNEFWERNQMKKALRQMARDLTWQGELLLRYYDQGNGTTTLKVIDPSSCWEIVTDPEDLDKVYYYHFQWPTPYQIWVSGQIPVTKYVIAQIPPTNIQHLKINVSAQERRGRSDLLPAMPWLKRFNDFYNGQTIKSILEANLVYKIKVKGDQSDVDAISQDPKLTILPPPGGVWVENEAMELTSTTAILTSGGRSAMDIGQQIAAIVATSLNLPAEYFNIAGGGGARATALVRTDPAVKTIEDRQQLLRETVEEMYDRVIQAAISAKRLDISAAREDPEAKPDEEFEYNTNR